MSEANKAVVRRFFAELINTGNLAVADELHAPEFKVYFPGFAPMDREGFKQLLPVYRAAFPDMNVAVDDIVAEGDRVAVRFTIRGTHRGEFMGVAPTGKQATWTGMGFYRIANGRILEDRVQEDTLGLMQQLGAIPAPAQAVR